MKVIIAKIVVASFIVAFLSGFPADHMFFAVFLHFAGVGVVFSTLAWAIYTIAVDWDQKRQGTK